MTVSFYSSALGEQACRFYTRNPMERRMYTCTKIRDYVILISFISFCGSSEGICWGWARRQGRQGEEEGREERDARDAGHLDRTRSGHVTIQWCTRVDLSDLQGREVRGGLG